MTSERTPMTPGRLTSYEELGAHRHLVISERLRARRRELGLTQKEVVARLRRIGVATTNKALSTLEHGAGLDVCKLPEIARALDCSLTYLVGLNDDPTAGSPTSRTGPAAVPRVTSLARPGCPPLRARGSWDRCRGHILRISR